MSNEDTREAEAEVDQLIDVTINTVIDDEIGFAQVFERIATALEQIAYQLKKINGKMR